MFGPRPGTWGAPGRGHLHSRHFHLLSPIFFGWAPRLVWVPAVASVVFLAIFAGICYNKICEVFREFDMRGESRCLLL